MSKELTEQWREGTLPAGYYYVVDVEGVKDLDDFNGENFSLLEVKEVLAPVPSCDQFVDLTEKVKELSSENGRLQYDNDVLSTVYDELFKRFERLQKKLDVAIATLELIEVKSDKFNSSMGLVEQLDDIEADCQATLHHLKEMEEV